MDNVPYNDESIDKSLENVRRFLDTRLEGNGYFVEELVTHCIDKKDRTLIRFLIHLATNMLHKNEKMIAVPTQDGFIHYLKENNNIPKGAVTL